MTEFIIVGDTAEHTGCLMAVGFMTRERAEAKIEDMRINPGEYRRVNEHHNIRVEEIDEKDAWWRHDRLD